jgi:hypothetical protein
MYDVVYIDPQGSETTVARRLPDCGEAKDLARRAAAERGAGRMMLTGSSSKPSNCVCIITTNRDLHPAA